MVVVNTYNLFQFHKGTIKTYIYTLYLLSS